MSNDKIFCMNSGLRVNPDRICPAFVSKACIAVHSCHGCEYCAVIINGMNPSADDVALTVADIRERHPENRVNLEVF
ncbi:hypothetical protein TALC_00398 [Thermoplasmatales archaeon BRNA1]|nr:hypothetical protein TALC_00398 [Thermoplasmatales archaeon BRNA1]